MRRLRDTCPCEPGDSQHRASQRACETQRLHPETILAASMLVGLTDICDTLTFQTFRLDKSQGIAYKEITAR
jgi:hypothetical protein